jgi:hypothetical protein
MHPELTNMWAERNRVPVRRHLIQAMLAEVLNLSSSGCAKGGIF